MTSLPCGKYKIIGIADSQTAYAVDLIHGNPYATVSSYTQNDVPFQLWNVSSVPINANGDCKVYKSYFRNDYNTDTYIGAYHKAEGVPLAGSSIDVGFTSWVVESASNTTDGPYYIKTEDEAYAWFVPGPGDYVAIVLKPFNEVCSCAGAKWTFQQRKS